MTDNNPARRQLFYERPEAVLKWPPETGQDRLVDSLAGEPGLAVVELAGRDSVAAAIRATEDRGFSSLLATVAFTGTEYGPWEIVAEAARRLARRLPGVAIHGPVVLGSPGFWQALCGRYAAECFHRFGFHTPCIGCHLYLHAIRVPLARRLGNAPIIAGERELHDGSVKVNQIAQAIDRYAGLCDHFGVELITPLRKTGSGREVEKILGMNWKQGEEQTGCVLSGNYRRADGVLPDAADVARFLDEFAVPAAKAVIASYLEGTVPRHLRIAGSIPAAPAGPPDASA